MLVINKGSKKIQADAIFLQPTRYCAMNCPQCVPAGTLISTPKGQIPVEQIQAGDKVYAYDNSSKQPVVFQVGDTYRQVSDLIIEIEVDEQVLQLTPEHPVMTRRGWVKAQDLTQDDEVLCDESHKE